MLLRWLLLLLQMLLLLSVFCLHLLRLLRVLLLHLLISRFVSLLLGRLLVVLLLLLLEFLVVLLLLRVELVLLLLVFLIRFGVSRVWCRRTFVGLNILGMRLEPVAEEHCCSPHGQPLRYLRRRNIVLRTTSLLVAGWRMIRRSRLSGRHGAGALEVRQVSQWLRPGACPGSPMPVAVGCCARLLGMLGLSSYRRNVLLRSPTASCSAVGRAVIPPCRRCS